MSCWTLVTFTRVLWSVIRSVKAEYVVLPGEPENAVGWYDAHVSSCALTKGQLQDS